MSLALTPVGGRVGAESVRQVFFAVLPLDPHPQGPFDQAEIFGVQVVPVGDVLLHPNRKRKSQRPGGAACG